MTLYGDVDHGQRSIKYWLVVWWHQAINCTIIDLLLMMPSNFHLKEIEQEML